MIDDEEQRLRLAALEANAKYRAALARWASLMEYIVTVVVWTFVLLGAFSLAAFDLATGREIGWCWFFIACYALRKLCAQLNRVVGDVAFDRGW